MRTEILAQIRNITRSFIEHGFAVYQKYPLIKGHCIVWEGFKDLSFSLKHEKYEVIYHECLVEKDFNILMIDGALIQFLYRFKKDEILEHRISFYPNPSIERYQDSPESYEETYYGQELFTEMFDEKVVCIPMRFDFNSDTKLHKDVDHPFCHLTQGNYSNCRIPIKAPITPYRFILFILRNFYYDKFIDSYTDDDFKCKISVVETITKNEKKLIHLNWS